MEGDNPAGGNGNLLAGLGIPTGPLVFVPQIEVPEARQVDTMTIEEGSLDRIKEKIHEFTGFPFVDSELAIQGCRQVRLGKRA
jgi:hypothetical protein